MSLVERLTGIAWRQQMPALIIGLGHGGTHWILATFYILLPFIADQFALSYAQVGLLVALMHASSVGSNLVGGPLVDVSGRRLLVQMLALLAGAAALFAFVAADRFIVLCVLVGVIGAANSLWHPAAISLLSMRYPRQRGYALSIHSLGANGGEALAPLVAGALLLSLSWNSVAAINALPAFAIAGLLLVLLPLDRAARGGAATGLSAGAYLSGALAVVRNRAIMVICLTAAFRTMAQSGLLAFVPLYLSDSMGVGPLWLGLALSAMQTGGIVAAPIAGTWSDRVGRRSLILAGLTLTTAIIVALTFIGHLSIFIAAIALLGFCLFGIRPVLQSWLLDLTPPALGGSATSLMFGCQGLLSIFTPLISGAIADVWGLTPVFYFLAAAMLIACLLVLVCLREDRVDREA